ncbi:hypothetical protein JVU11DRAFT_7556 [Chiua virens]|nr:hypothetical protein JVU11DRAFT_7556 [Chiua virens]
MDHEYDILDGYLPSFVEHLKDTRTRLGLETGSASDTHDAVEDVCAPSNWTSAEHNAFFRALSIHSRWRPDLIAACIPTKHAWERRRQSTWRCPVTDVRTADASAAHSEPDTGEEAWAWCEPALEVSQAWIDVEERMASWIVQQEGLMSVEEEDVDCRGRRRGITQADARTEPRRYSLAVDDDCRSPSLGSPSTSARQLSVLSSRREALMGCLESAHLLVLDGILREGEEATKEKGKSREGSVMGTTPTQHGDYDEHQVDVQRLSNRTSMTQGTSNDSGPFNVAIDPVLLALSGDADPVGRHPRTSLEVSSQPGAGNMLVFPLDDPGPSENVDSDLSVLSPRSRRRIQKRLYMRRKRATLREDGVIDTGVLKLKPGKKAKVDRRETPAISQSVLDSEGPSDDEGEPAENVRRKNKGGLTLPYKLKAQFGELGIDAAYLRSQGMDLLNLGALGKLMGLHASLELGEEEPDMAQVRHLQAVMVSFVTDIIHRAIVWREREIRLKQRCQAWRQGDQITISAIEHAVEVVGARYHSHKEHFKALEVFHGRSSEHSNPPVNETEPSHADPGVDAADLLAVLSSHRETYTPLIRPPATWTIGPVACLSRTYEQEATRTRRGPSAELDDELMSDETDSEALTDELAEEEEREELDMEEGEREQKRLWEMIYKI